MYKHFVIFEEVIEHSLTEAFLEKALSVEEDFLRISIAMKKHHDHSGPYKGKPFIGAAYIHKIVLHYWRKHGSKHATDELRVLHLDPQTSRRAFEHLKHQMFPTVIDFLQQGRNYSSRTTHPNIDILW